MTAGDNAAPATLEITTECGDNTVVRAIHDVWQVGLQS
jgi:hypothetical protein